MSKYYVDTAFILFSIFFTMYIYTTNMSGNELPLQCLNHRSFSRLLHTNHKSIHTTETDLLPFIIFFQVFRWIKLSFKLNSNLVILLELVDDITFGSKWQTPLETDIWLSNKSVSSHWHCKPTTVKNICITLSESSSMAPSYLEQVVILTHTTEVDHNLPVETGVVSFYSKNALE